jgi:hypothetical protein
MDRWMLMLLFWVTTPYELVGRYQKPCRWRDGDSMFVQNVGIYHKSTQCHNLEQKHRHLHRCENVIYKKKMENHKRLSRLNLNVSAATVDLFINVWND